MAMAELTQFTQWTRKALLPLLAAAALSACGDRSTDIPPAADQPL